MMALARLSDDELVRVLNGARIGLGRIGGGCRPSGPGSRRQLADKALGVLAEMRARKLTAVLERVMDGYCRAYGCIEEDDDSGLCQAHAAKWRSGQEVHLAGPLPPDSEFADKTPEPAAASTQPKRPAWNSRKPGATQLRERMSELRRKKNEDEQSNQPDRQAGPRVNESTNSPVHEDHKVAAYKCEKCDKVFPTGQGFPMHVKSCKGPVSDEVCGVDGCTRLKGHSGHHYRGGSRKPGITPPAQSPAATEARKAARKARKIPRRTCNIDHLAPAARVDAAKSLLTPLGFDWISLDSTTLLLADGRAIKVDADGNYTVGRMEFVAAG